MRFAVDFFGKEQGMGAQVLEGRIEKRVLDDIRRIAEKNSVRKVVLFGSRARGDAREDSDIDLAINGGDHLGFYYDLEEDAWTLLSFDVVNMDERVTPQLSSEISRDGVVIYEKI